MKEKIIKKLNDWKFFILVLVILGGAFYWYEVRPAMIYKDCTRTAAKSIKEAKGNDGDNYNLFYKICLTARGINK